HAQRLRGGVPQRARGGDGAAGARRRGGRHRRAVSARRIIARDAAVRGAVRARVRGAAARERRGGGRVTGAGALARVGVPTLAVAAFLLAWEGVVRALQIPAYLLPAPSLIATTLADNLGSLAASWWFTLR